MLNRKLLSVVAVAALAFGVAGCNKTEYANANTSETATRLGPDNSEITTSVDASGMKTETRVFRNNPRVSKVVVTTRNGRRTVTVYAPSGEARELNKNEPEDVLEATGSAIADAVGFVADKTEDVAGATKEGAKTAAEKTAEGTKTAAKKTAEGAKTAAEKTGEAAKKTGKAIKKAVTP